LQQPKKKKKDAKAKKPPQNGRTKYRKGWREEPSLRGGFSGFRWNKVGGGGGQPKRKKRGHDYGPGAKKTIWKALPRKWEYERPSPGTFLRGTGIWVHLPSPPGRHYYGGIPRCKGDAPQ